MVSTTYKLNDIYLWQHKVSAHWNGRWRHLFLSPPYCQALRAPFWRLLKTCLDWEYIHILSCLVVRYECKMDNVKCFNLRSIQIKDIESRCLKVCNIESLTCESRHQICFCWCFLIIHYYFDILKNVVIRDFLQTGQGNFIQLAVFQEIFLFNN